MENSPNWLLSILSFAGTKLGLPLHEIAIIQQAKQLVLPNQILPFLLGNIEYAKCQWPIFSFDQDLTLITQIPATYSYLVCLNSANTRIGLGLMCETVTTINLHQSVYPIPNYAQFSFSPLQQWCWYNDNLLALSNTVAIAQYISHEIEHYSA